MGSCGAEAGSSTPGLPGTQWHTVAGACCCCWGAGARAQRRQQAQALPAGCRQPGQQATPNSYWAECRLGKEAAAKAQLGAFPAVPKIPFRIAEWKPSQPEATTRRVISLST